ncbi:hypothetical protein CHARACLAT_031199 [Characodon lateralis]|uniref:Uncharacterized protein n=1 Tax=Characodon lateralis TaxID=208331 RepID=A0ABU7DVR6_9TELE|nr:hypothetical protein [Characodon lateralis]
MNHSVSGRFIHERELSHTPGLTFSLRPAEANCLYKPREAVFPASEKDNRSRITMVTVTCSLASRRNSRHSPQLITVKDCGRFFKLLRLGQRSSPQFMRLSVWAE